MNEQIELEMLELAKTKTYVFIGLMVFVAVLMIIGLIAILIGNKKK